MTSPRASLLAATAFVALTLCSPLAAQEEIKGDAILKHPTGQLAVKAAGLLTAGKAEEVVALGTKGSQAEWKKESAEDRKGMSEMMQRRAPAPAVYSEAIRKAGTLLINDTFAILRVELDKGDAAIAYFEREAGTWRLTNGPMVIEGAGAPVNETRVEGEELLKHPVAALAAQYVALVHAGKMDDAMRQLGSADAQAQWKKDPASERAESLAYLKKTLPTAAELKAQIANGVLIIEDGDRGTLNMIKQEQKTTAPGTTSYSSTTVTIPVVLENGTWKIAR